MNPSNPSNISNTGKTRIREVTPGTWLLDDPTPEVSLATLAFHSDWQATSTPPCPNCGSTGQRPTVSRFTRTTALIQLPYCPCPAGTVLREIDQTHRARYRRYLTTQDTEGDMHELEFPDDATLMNWNIANDHHDPGDQDPGQEYDDLDDEWPADMSAEECQALAYEASGDATWRATLENVALTDDEAVELEASPQHQQWLTEQDRQEAAYWSAQVWDGKTGA